MEGHTEVVDLLIKAGADIHQATTKVSLYEYVLVHQKHFDCFNGSCLHSLAHEVVVHELCTSEFDNF